MFKRNNYKITEYKEWIICVVAISVVLMLVFYTSVYFFFGAPFFNQWIRDTYAIKEGIAKSIKTKKIVIIGGSNGYFGVNAKLMQEQMRIPTVNLGMHAGLTLDYMLYRVKHGNYLHKGDILVLPVEYFLISLAKERSYSQTRTFYVLQYDKPYFNQLPLPERARDLINVKFIDLLKGFREQRLYSSKSWPNFEAEDLTETGDTKLGKGNTQVLNDYRNKIIRPMHRYTAPYMETRTLRAIKSLDEWSKERGITLFVTYQPLVYFDEYFRDKLYKKEFKFLINYYKKNKIKTLGLPLDYVYDITYFYNTDFHLNNDGAKIHTQQLVNGLKNAGVQ